MVQKHNTQETIDFCTMSELQYLWDRRICRVAMSRIGGWSSLWPCLEFCRIVLLHWLCGWSSSRCSLSSGHYCSSSSRWSSGHNVCPGYWSASPIGHHTTHNYHTYWNSNKQEEECQSHRQTHSQSNIHCVEVRNEVHSERC